jgi:hypothetical protein
LRASELSYQSLKKMRLSEWDWAKIDWLNWIFDGLGDFEAKRIFSIM